MRGILLKTQATQMNQHLMSASTLLDNALRSLVLFQVSIHLQMKKLKSSWLLMLKSKKPKPKKYPKGGNK